MSAIESIATPGAADLAVGHRVVRVVAELRRQVERDRQPRLPAREQIAVALVRLLRRREPRVLADRPRSAAIHVRVRAAREREDARRLRLDRRCVRGPVQRLHLDAGVEQPPVGGAGHASDPTSTPAGWWGNARQSRPTARAGQSTPPARSIASSAIRLPDSMCVRIACWVCRQVAGLEGLDDRAMLACQILASLEPAAADHLHHQVHRQLPVRCGRASRCRRGRSGTRGRRRSPCPIPPARSPPPTPPSGPESGRGAPDRRLPTVRSAACSSSASRTSYPSPTVDGVTGVT